MKAAVVTLVAALVATVAHAQTLAPHQQRALDTIVATFEPEMRPVIRAQFTALLAGMDERTVAAFVAAFTSDDTEPAPSWDDAPGEASPEVIAYNRAQYEPAIRSAWTARRSFDEFVTARLAEACPPPGRYAVFGLGWRFEVAALQPRWTTMHGEADTFVEMLGATYAYKPARARYDFSAMRYEFDRDAVGSAITSACAEYHRIGEAFMAEARRRVADSDLSQGERIAGEAGSRVDALRERLERLFEAQIPADDLTLYGALMNATPVN
jgi:hypothetical protein